MTDLLKNVPSVLLSLYVFWKGSVTESSLRPSGYFKLLNYPFIPAYGFPLLTGLQVYWKRK